ncbi:MAG TPA: ATP-dependent DNA helicase RecQ [Paludibacteraceae bacterium]|nr:ATP-dependent DNA helicase RecQ [Paludibacteraceae bacterium]HQF49975.1 ATP-dependent DNA helicase RecQ [Paludibacteraceae bacterium]
MDKYTSILQQYWGYDDFRPLQGDIIRSVGEGHDTLGLMPTGGGKSITFQVPAMAMDGTCIVVTPLIALMKDQVDNLRARGIKAATVYSGMTRNEILVALDNCVLGDYKFLYVSPERLATEIFLTKLKQMNVCLLAVDESHCISQWGYDFRPSYLKIADIREFLPGVPVLALTATATKDVVDDIQNQLKFKEKCVFKKSFERKNIAYVVRDTEDKMGQMLKILDSVPGTSIVYVRSRQKTKEVSDILNVQGISASYYQAGLSNETKDVRQQAWKSGETRVIVATNAFGMGIDKPDVRTVIHLDLPDTLEAYFQEAGRAGRDGEKAYAILLYNKSDNAKLKKRIPDNFPEKDFVKRIYEAVCNYLQVAEGSGLDCSYDFSLGQFCSAFKFPMLPAYSALKILQQCGYLELTDDEDNKSRVMFIVKRDDLYGLTSHNNDQDELMKVLLRSYTGLFSEYAYIDEVLLGKRLNLTRDEVYNGLVALAKNRIISYVPGKKTPLIIFTQPRMDVSRIVITKDSYDSRKKRFEDKIAKVTAYASEQNRCRSRMLLHYFGEDDSHNCGCCDYCLSNNQRSVNYSELHEIKERVFDALYSSPMSMPDLLAWLKGDEEHTISVIRLMQDNGDIEMGEDGRLAVVK